jgi:alpha-1,2-mannosyltransferase
VSVPREGVLPAKSRGLPRRDLVVVAVVCGAFGAYGWAIFVTTFVHDGALGVHFNTPGVDFTVFYAAARAYLEGNLPLIFDGWRFTNDLNVRFASILSGPLPFHPWLYPPHFLLLLLPFGLLSFGFSYAVFVTTTLAALIIVIWRFARPGYARRLQLAALLLSPAAAITATAGQNAFLTAALLGRAQ